MAYVSRRAITAKFVAKLKHYDTLQKKYFSRVRNTFYGIFFLAAAHCSPCGERARGISVFRLATKCIVDVLFICSTYRASEDMQFMNSQLILSHDMHHELFSARRTLLECTMRHT